MARLVKHDRSEPYKVEQGGQTIWVCDEEPGAVYLYDAHGLVKVPTEY